MRPVTPFAFLLAITFALPTVAPAQLLDHLKCHKVKDPLKLKATADFNALQSQFSAQGCIVSKPKLFCVPATKSNVTPPEAAPLVVDGQQLENNYICYSAKCTDAPPSTDVADQFGARTQTSYRTTLVCAPAVTGLVTTTTSVPGATTTTTTLPGTPACGSAAAPECNGTCSAGSVCANAGSGHCGCVSGAPACGSYQGAPACSGTCPGATPFCKTVGASCSCSGTP